MELSRLARSVDADQGPLAVGAVVSAREWRGALQRHCRDHVADTVVRMVRDARDALEEPVEVLVVDDDTSYLSAPFVLRLRERGVVTVGIYDPDEADGHGYRYLLSVGVDLALPATLPPEELLEAVSELRPDRVTQRRFRDLTAGLEERIDECQRRVIAVTGPTGSGATEVSIALSALLADGAAGPAGAGRPLLLDLDDVQPSIARRLGLGLHPHIVTAIEALRRERVDAIGEAAASLEQCLARPAVGAPPPFDVLVGLASRDDWALLRADDALDLVDEASARWPVVVARLGAVLDDLGRWVPRYDVARRGLQRSTVLVAVCEASPLGVLRFLDWLGEASLLAPGGAVDVVLNRAPRSPDQRAQLIDQLVEVGGPRIRSITPAPRDRRVERAAWDAEVPGRGPFLKSLRPLAHELAVVA